MVLSLCFVESILQGILVHNPEAHLEMQYLH
jgi:hypothetical protein